MPEAISEDMEKHVKLLWQTECQGGDHSKKTRLSQYMSNVLNPCWTQIGIVNIGRNFFCFGQFWNEHRHRPLVLVETWRRRFVSLSFVEAKSRYQKRSAAEGKRRQLQLHMWHVGVSWCISFKTSCKCQVSAQALGRLRTKHLGIGIFEPAVRVHHGVLPSFVGCGQRALHGRHFWSDQTSFACGTCAAKQQLVAFGGLLLWARGWSTSFKTRYQHGLGRAGTPRWIGTGISSSIWWSRGQMGCGKTRLGHIQLRAKTCNGHRFSLAVALCSRFYSATSRDSFCYQLLSKDCYQRLALCFAGLWQRGSSSIAIACGGWTWCSFCLWSQAKLWQQQLSCHASQLVAACCRRPPLLGVAFCSCHCQRS